VEVEVLHVVLEEVLLNGIVERKLMALIAMLKPLLILIIGQNYQ